MVEMLCMTTKKKFDVEEPEVVQLKNSKYAFRAKCPWKGKNEKELYAWKFCRRADYELYLERPTPEIDPNAEQDNE